MGSEGATPPAAPGTSSEELASKRTDYYDKWDKFTKESEADIAREEEEARAKASEALGLNKDEPKSEAEKRDREKREALKEAKKAWDQRKMSEAAMRQVFDDEYSGKEITLESNLIGDKRVVSFKGAKGSTFTLPASLNAKLVKVFIEECEDCTFNVETVTITSHVEVSNCTDCKVLFRATNHILQADLCKGLEVRYAPGVFQPGEHKFFHAGVEDSSLHIHHPEGKIASEEICYLKLGAKDHDAERPAEVQYLSHVQNGDIVTERVYRSRGNMPLTQAEIDAAEAAGDGDGLQSRERAAELKKIGGNEAFQEGNYAQACVFYREGLDIAPETAEIVPTLWSNLAFSRLKLGHHAEALEAADEALKLKPDMTKALFRKGIALHAMKRYREAAIELSKALELEPKNKEIKQALTFAEMRLRQASTSA
ncbi:Small glutamine-rich tetratricopeptide repeat-containing protein beta [Hondaea fermentalgiana]|uniref:Small glutamine-rich tetratricopeptide repeat-containing protein beta n=1 Tax=Hondaea fermentalgiana TaxID=2315210 RepID=A0A2R5G8F2_9STRA|nr:Small glutamine-rich tetratricopeptide repeat-containing protein beta [Hondaea fermentalgiana]|eukprot:GBG26058.1 Small glutamine-rich tetratricopeptide repeat-containing protein beta [Hondaea fermentalgiana]